MTDPCCCYRCRFQFQLLIDEIKELRRTLEERPMRIPVLTYDLEDGGYQGEDPWYWLYG